MGRSLQRSPVWVSFLSSRQASVRVELGRSAGPEHPQVQPHISCHPRRAPLASNQKKDRLQDRPYGPSLLGWCCTGIPDGTVPSCWLSRRSTMSSVGFSWWPRCSKVSASDIWSSGLRSGPQIWNSLPLRIRQSRDNINCFSNRNWKRICFSSSDRFCDPYLMKGLISFLYYYYYDDYYYYYYYYITGMVPFVKALVVRLKVAPIHANALKYNIVYW